MLVRVGKEAAGVEYGLSNVVKHKKTKTNPGMETSNLISLMVWLDYTIIRIRFGAESAPIYSIFGM